MASTRLYKLTLGQQCAYWAYSALVQVLKLGLLVTQSVNGTRNDAKWLERYGHFQPTTRRGGWLIHCVSMGEVTAAAGLVRDIRRHQPNLPIVLTTTTATGAEQVERLLGDEVEHHYLPYDTSGAMKRLLVHFAPKKVVIMEVELWPNMMRQCVQFGVPVYVINGRMTENSMVQYRKLSALFRPMLQALTHIAVQGERDHRHYLQLGADASQLSQTGNLKFDVAVADDLLHAKQQARERFGAERRRVLIGGSTHAPEESVLLTHMTTLKKEFSDLLLILVPRHPERFDEVAELCGRSGLTWQRWSASQTTNEDGDVLLIDQMGLLNDAYLCADVAFVGGSLADRGGHNALEPAACEVPIIMGPNQYNNPVICQSLEDCGALRSVHDEEELLPAIQNWLRHPDQREMAAQAGLRAIECNRGATQRTLQVLEVVSASHAST